MSNIILIGYMGCGKSTIGKKLSYAVRKPYVDTDKLIEKNEAVKGLIVPVSQLSEAVRDVKTKGNILNTYARQLERMNRRS